jgi:hypothetical protein
MLRKKVMAIEDACRNHIVRVAGEMRHFEKEFCRAMRQTHAEIALEIAWKYHGTWYTWGGDDPSGFDCSGLVIECLKSVGILPRGRQYDWTANGLWHLLSNKRVAYPAAGRLVFWQNDQGHCIHVELCINETLAIGASGGGPFVRCLDDAIKYNAFIKIRPIESRKGIKGYIDPFMEVAR